MDEPTNHLDLWSCAALERSIREFEGTVLVVSHDRYFLNQAADRIIALGNGRARVIEGDYETYQRLTRQEQEAAASARQAAATAVAPTVTTGATGAGKRKRKFPYRKPADIEGEITRVEGEIAQLEAALGDAETWRDGERARATRERYDRLQADLASLYEHWEEALELNA